VGAPNQTEKKKLIFGSNPCMCKEHVGVSIGLRTGLSAGRLNLISLPKKSFYQLQTLCTMGVCLPSNSTKHPRYMWVLPDGSIGWVQVRVNDPKR
jgi:hypothetical protein